MYSYDDFYCRHSSKIRSVYDLFIRIWNFHTSRKKTTVFGSNAEGIKGKTEDYSRLSHYDICEITKIPGSKWNHCYTPELLCRASKTCSYSKYLFKRKLHFICRRKWCAMCVLHPQQPLYMSFYYDRNVSLQETLDKIVKCANCLLKVKFCQLFFHFFPQWLNRGFKSKLKVQSFFILQIQAISIHQHNFIHLPINLIRKRQCLHIGLKDLQRLKLSYGRDWCQRTYRFRIGDRWHGQDEWRRFTVNCH